LIDQMQLIFSLRDICIHSTELVKRTMPQSMAADGNGQRIQTEMQKAKTGANKKPIRSSMTDRDPVPARPAARAPRSPAPQIPLKLPDALGFELASAIEQQIIYLELKPGAHLIEQDVCDNFGVSRSPVREAFRELEASGLVVRYQRRGVRVTPMTETDFDEIQECRAPLEAIAAAAAAKNASDADIAEMQAAISAMKRAFADRNIRDFFRFNIAFFETMHRAANNKMLLRMLSVIEKQASRYRYLAHVHSESMLPFVLKSNTAIFEGISSRKAGLARSATLSIMAQAREIIVDVLRKHAKEIEG
jgi:DNA-binding GntR family transcriptional regulator